MATLLMVACGVAMLPRCPRVVAKSYISTSIVISEGKKPPLSLGGNNLNWG